MGNWLSSAWGSVKNAADSFWNWDGWGNGSWQVDPAGVIVVVATIALTVVYLLYVWLIKTLRRWCVGGHATHFAPRYVARILGRR